MKNRLLAVIALMAMILSGPACNQNASSSQPALKVTAKDVWLSDPEDLDGDGYASYMHLNMDLDVNRNSLDVFVEVYVRLHDPADTSGYYPYFPPPETTSPVFTIAGDAAEDAVYISLGKPNIELPQAEWDFGVLVYSAANPDEPVLGFDFSSVPAFGAVAMEEAVSDDGIIIYDAWWFNEEDTDGDGYNSKASLAVDVDVRSGTSTDYAYLELWYKPAAAPDYTFRGSTPYLTIEGESETDAVGIILDNAFSHGSYDFRVAAMIHNGEVVEDVVDKSTSGVIGEGLGGVQLELASEEVFTVTFINHVFTPISVFILNHGSRTIPVGGSAQYDFASNPGTLRYSASTSGQTTTGEQVGILISWQGALQFSGPSTKTVNLNLSSDKFFIYLNNRGTKTLGPLYVNYGLTDQTYDNITIQANNTETYTIGYYNAHSNTEIRTYITGESGYVYWQHGVHFTLPFTQNQSVTLLNTYKTGKAPTSAVVSAGRIISATAAPLAVGSVSAQGRKTAGFQDPEQAIDPESISGAVPDTVVQSVQQNPAFAAGRKLEVVPIPGRSRMDHRRAAMGPAGSSGGPMVRKPPAQKVRVDRQAVAETFSGAERVRLKK